jgi:transcriptional regulator with XRE-family HTH domain
MATFKDMRESLGLSPAEMAVKLKVTTGTLANWESGRTLPHGDPATISRYCDAYLCNLSQLVEAQKQSGYLR